MGQWVIGQVDQQTWMGHALHITHEKFTAMCYHGAILEKWVPYSQRHLVLRLVGLVGSGLPLL